jgi:hypothetical protein
MDSIVSIIGKTFSRRLNNITEIAVIKYYIIIHVLLVG